ncbi:MAG: thioredoxin domain-containing protein [Gemmatimonadales bacterium]|nr:thioredoxin domain-containing protein [Gemmatimonadales bacterium]MYG50089.1 thioredoxin domain-containing protein [Gemmatimonadales bacterium]MYK03259.1 thioredoxin domain-containing protein [Candidatus Palauibacter ramosifaciens]
MTARSHSSADKGDGRWNRVVNIAILGVLAILLFNPSGVVGSWIIAEYKGWQEQRRIALNWPELTNASSYLGPSPLQDGAVIVEFVDYDCPVCKAVAPAVLEGARGRGVTVVMRHVPSERRGPAATEAALAAICAEQYGLFPEAHGALISDETWLETRDWVGFAVNLGVGDPESFGNCVSEEEAPQRRLARDVELAEVLRIPGTPTFVSAEELHLGAPGLASALAAAALLRPRAPRRPSTDPVFDSSEHRDLSERLLSVKGGFFTPDGGLVVVDRTEIHMIDMASGEHRVVGREGGGPEEFGVIWQAVRTSEGVTVRDFLRGRIVSIGHDGDFGHSQSYLDVPLNGSQPRLVARHPDGSTVFRDRVSDAITRKSKGRYWRQARYVAVDSDGGLRVVAETQGNERYSDTRLDRPVLFGHRTLEAATSDRLVVAETDQGSISVLDWSGVPVASIPMPPGVRLSADQVRRGRESEASQQEESRGRFMEAALDGRFPFPPSFIEERLLPTRPPDWPANEVAPPIDAMLTDFDSRLWVRDYRLPGQDSVTWRVWDIDREQLLFTVSMDGEDRLLDARGDEVLLRRLDPFDAHQVVVTPLLPEQAKGGT